MVAATVFFMMESRYDLKTSLNVDAMVALVLAARHFYMCEYWLIIRNSPFFHWSIDWSISVPLQMV